MAFVDKDSVGTTYAGPSVSFIGAGNKLTFSRGSGGFETDVAGVNYGNTAFANGTTLIGAGGFQGPGDGGPVVLAFAVPTVQFGLNIEDFGAYDSGLGKYGINFQAYDPTGKIIATTDASGGIINGPDYNALGCADNSCLSFEGLSVYGDAISFVVFDDSGSNSGLQNNLMFGNIEIAPQGTAL